MGQVVANSFQNFSRGKLDHNMMGRYDLPIYTSGADVFENFLSNFQGNAKYRAGFEEMLTAQDGALAEFKFNNTQDYILFFYANTIQFAAYDNSGNFGWVLSGMSPFTVTTPYTLAECKQLQLTQNSDVMFITHPNHPPYALTRTSASTFTMFPQSRFADPFTLTYDSTKTISGISNATQAQFTISGHGYSVNDRFQVLSVSGMTAINNYVATVISVVDANNVLTNIDTSNTAIYVAYTSGGTAGKVLTGAYPQCCCFYQGRLWYANTTVQVTGLWGSQSALYEQFEIVTTPVDTDAIFVALGTITQPITWIYSGDNSMIVGSADGIAAINGGDINTPVTPSSITETISTALGSNFTQPIRKDGFMFYVGVNGRNLYYFAYNFLYARFEAHDANLIAYDITEGGLNKLRWKKDRDDLIFMPRGDGDLVSLNFQKDENINGWHEHNTANNGIYQDIAVMTDSSGNPQLFALMNRAGTFYLERMRPFIEFVELSHFYSGGDSTSQANDKTAYIRMVSEQLKQCNFMDNANQLSGLQTANTITFDPVGLTITATSGVFNSGHVGRHISYQTMTGYESGRFLITAYTSSTVVSVKVLQAPTANTYPNWYLTFNTISGLDRFDGMTVGVVINGGYQTSYVVSGGTISLGKESEVAWVGLLYRGLIKSFSLGFQVQAKNTQMTMKNLVKFGIRFICSAGVKIGTSQYDAMLAKAQTLSQNDLNYCPPIPMDGTKFIDFVDSPEQDKYFYVVQDEPLPCEIAAVMIEGNYVV